MIQASMAYCANIIGSLFYLQQEIVNPATSFSLFLVPLFWYSLSISGFSLYLIFLYSICKAGLSLYLLFWYSLCFNNFPGTLFFYVLFYFLYFLCIGVFDITVAFQDFPDLYFFICNIWCSTFHIILFYILF